MGRSIENSTTIIVNSNASSGFSDGSATTPSIYFSNDSNTGLYRVGAETIGVSTNGIKQLEVSNTATISTNQITTPSIRITTGAGAGKVLESDASGNASWVSATSTVIRTFNRTSWSSFDSSDAMYVFANPVLNITILNNEVLMLSGRMLISNLPVGASPWHRLANFGLYGIALDTIHGIVYDRLRVNSSFPFIETEFRLTSGELELVIENGEPTPITNQVIHFMATGRVA